MGSKGLPNHVRVYMCPSTYVPSPESTNTKISAAPFLYTIVMLWYSAEGFTDCTVSAILYNGVTTICSWRRDGEVRHQILLL